MKNGFIRIPRRLFESAAWQQNRTYSEAEAIIDIYQSADKQGQLSTTKRTLAERWRWEPTRVLRLLQRMERNGYIAITKSKNGTTITVIDFGGSKQVVAPPNAPPNAPPKSPSAKDFSGVDAPPNAPPNAPPRAYKKNIIISYHGDDNKKSPLNPPTGETSKFDWSLLSDPLKPIAEEWLRYKKEKRQTYTPIGFKAFCNKLTRLSDGDPLKARMIIEHSMSNNYSGIFEIKNYGTVNNGNNAQQRAQEAAGIIARLAAEDDARWEP